MQLQSPSSTEPSFKPTTHHPESQEMRARVVELRRLAESIESSLVMVLVDGEGLDGWGGLRASLCERMLVRNLHQLHSAVEELRESALSLSEQADQLDLEHQTCVA